MTKEGQGIVHYFV